MKVKDRFMNLGVFHVSNGRSVRFWEDKWLGNFTLQLKYPRLYNLVQRKNATVASVFSTIPLNIYFQRGLYDVNLIQWHALVANTNILDTDDTFWWNLHQNKSFSVHSIYEPLACDGHVTHDRLIWKLKVPLKIKFFFWYLKRGVVLTKDN